MWRKSWTPPRNAGGPISLSLPSCSSAYRSSAHSSPAVGWRSQRASTGPDLWFLGAGMLFFRCSTLLRWARAGLIEAIFSPDTVPLKLYRVHYSHFPVFWVPPSVSVRGAFPAGCWPCSRFTCRPACWSWERLRQLTSARAALMGTNAAVVGLLLAAFYDPIWTTAVTDSARLAFALAAFALLRFASFPPWLLVLLSAGLGHFCF